MAIFEASQRTAHTPGGNIHAFEPGTAFQNAFFSRGFRESDLFG